MQRAAKVSRHKVSLSSSSQLTSELDGRLTANIKRLSHISIKVLCSLETCDAQQCPNRYLNSAQGWQQSSGVALASETRLLTVNSDLQQRSVVVATYKHILDPEIAQ